MWWPAALSCHKNLQYVSRRWPVDTGQSSGVIRRSRDSKSVQVCINSFFSFCCWYSHLQEQILRNRLAADEDRSAPLNHWQSLSGPPDDDVLPVGSHRALYSVVVSHIFESLVNNQTTQPPGCRSRPMRRLASRGVHISVWSPPKRRSSKSGCRSYIGLWNYPAVSLRLWCIGRHSWIPCTILQKNSRPLTAP